MNTFSDLLAAPRYSTDMLAKATNIPAETIRTWFKRDILNFEGGHMGEGVPRKGLGRSYSGYTALTVAVMGQLLQQNLTAIEARDLAFRFIAAGDEERIPGYIFEDGETLLIFGKRMDEQIVSRIVNVGGSGYGSAPEYTWHQLFGLLGHSVHSIQVIRLTELWQGVTSKLGIRAALEAEWEVFSKK